MGERVSIRSGHSGAPVRGASEQVALHIRRHIQGERLGPGDFLGREDDLAAEFGVSRATLREALKLLASGNLIRATKGPGGGIFVANTAEQGMSRSVSQSIAAMLESAIVSLEELLEARLLLEVPLAGLAAHRADEATISRLREARSDGGGPEIADSRIHAIIASAAGNRVVEALTGWVREVAQPALAEAIDDAVVRSAVGEQLDALIAAIEKGDSARAERAMEDHLLYLRDVLRLVRERSSD
ncbi:MAG TPA: GntR family transcriptional regulator [Actinomycetota bacterium]|nr:GntR family transcriptional regulator [Actinomycetota bacterium]